MIQPISNPQANFHAASWGRQILLRGARRRTGFIVALLLLAMVSAASAEDAPSKAPAKAMLNTWYTTTISQSSSGFMFTHFWSKGVKMRSEVVIAGRRIVTIVTPTHYYTLDLTRGTGLGVERSALAKAADANRIRPFADEYAALLRGGGEFVSEETLANQSVDMYRLTNNAGRIQVWVTKKLNLPVRVERWNRATGRRDHIDYIDWLRGFPIADSFFEPPAGLDVETFAYGEYVSRAMSEPLGPAPPLYSHLLHGEHLKLGESAPAVDTATEAAAEGDAAPRSD